MKTKLFLIFFGLVLSFVALGQQLGDGQNPNIDSFNKIWLSGMYTSDNAQPGFPLEIPSWRKKHFIVSNSYGNMLQIASTAWEDDRMFFRKVNDDGSGQPNTYGKWNELATGGKNAFTETQYFTGDGEKLVLGSIDHSQSLEISMWSQDGYFNYPKSLFFKNRNEDNSAYVMIDHKGRVGIGKYGLSHKLEVKGTIRAEEIILETFGADFVFESDYRLKPLSEVKSI